MIEYLQFPLQNVVGKKLSSGRYIKSANLTDAEYKRIAPYLDGIDILYSFPFEDGEVIVLLAYFSEEEFSRYTLHNFVMAIAQSVPYPILLIVKCEGVIRFFVFDERENQLNRGRSKVLSINYSTDIVLLENDLFDNILFAQLRTAAEESKSAKELHSRWYTALSGREDYDNGIIINTFSYSLERYRELVSRNKAFQRATDKNNVKYSISDPPEEIYDGIPFDIDDELEQRCFVEFCGAFSRQLYRDSGNDISEEEWLQVYLDGCNSYAMSLFNRVLNSKCAEIISSIFWDEDADIIEYYQAQFDLEELKEHIGNFYFTSDYEVV